LFTIVGTAARGKKKKKRKDEGAPHLIGGPICGSIVHMESLQKLNRRFKEVKETA